MKWTIDKVFETSANKDVIAFLKNHSPSAHSDLVDELRLAAKGAPEAHLYCPDPANYAFFAVHRSDYTIVALALGMKQIIFRLSSSLASDALRDGGTQFSDIGDGWVSFSPSSPHEPLVVSRQRLGHWCRQALSPKTGE